MDYIKIENINDLKFEIIQIFIYLFSNLPIMLNY